MFVRWLIFYVLVLAFSFPASAQTAKSLLKACTAEEISPATRIETCTKAINSLMLRGDDRAMAHQMRAAAYFYSERYEDAYGETELTLAVSPQHPGAYFLRGLVRAKQGDPTSAIAMFSEAIRLNPKLGGAYVERAQLYFDQGEVDKAKNDLAVATNLNPQDAHAASLLRSYEGDTGKMKLAERLVETDPQRAITLLNQIDQRNVPTLLPMLQAQAYENAGQLEQAKAAYDYWMEIKGRTWNILQNRAGFFIRTAQFDKSFTDLDEANRVEASETKASNSNTPSSSQCKRIWALFLKGDADAALAEARAFGPLKANTLMLTTSQLFSTLGWKLAGDCYYAMPLLLARSGKLAEAVDLADALEAQDNPAQTYPLAYYVRGKVHDAQGDKAAAFRAYSRFLGSKLKMWDEKRFIPLATERRAALEQELATTIGTAEADCKQAEDRARRRSGCTLVLASAPNSISAYLGLAEASMRPREKNVDALRALNGALSLDPQNVKALVARGYEHLKGNSASVAGDDFKAALAIDPKNAAARVGSAFVLGQRERDQLGSALDQIEAVLKENPRLVDGILARGALRTDRGWTLSDKEQRKAEWKNALADFQSVLAQEPNNVRALLSTARVQSALLDTSAASTALSRVLDLDPEDAEARADRAELRAKAGDRTGAIDDYTVALSSSRPSGYNKADWTKKRADEYMQLKNYSSAIQDYTAALAIYEKAKNEYAQPALRDKRGLSLLMAGRLDEAEADFRASLANTTQQQKDAALTGLGLTDLARGKCSEAADELVRARLANPYNRDAPFALAVSKHCLGSFAEASSLYEEQFNKTHDSYSLIYRFIAQSQMSGVDARAELEKLVQRAGKDWPNPVLGFLLSQGDASSVEAAASNDDRRCEADYYIGAKNLIDGDKAAATARLTKAAAACPISYYEYTLAVVTLKNLSTPIPARAKQTQAEPQTQASAVSNLSSADKALRDACTRAEASLPNPSKIEACTKAIESGKMKGGDLADVYVMRAARQYDAGFVDESLADVQAALDASPNSSSAYYMRSFGRWKKRDLKAALADVDRAIELDPKFEAAYVRRARLRYEHGDVDLAKEDIQQALRLEPDDAEAKKMSAAYEGPEAKLKLAESLLEKDPKKAIELLKSLKQGDVQTILSAPLTKAYEAAGANDLAAAEYAQWMQAKGISDGLLTNRAGFYIRIGKFDEALSDLVEADKLSAKNEKEKYSNPRPSQCNLIWAEYLKGDIDKAAKHLSEVVLSTPTSLSTSTEKVGRSIAQHLWRLGGSCFVVAPILLAEQGKVAEAVTFADGYESDDLENGLPLALFARGVALEKAGRLPPAYLEFTRYLRGDLTYWDEKRLAQTAELRARAIKSKLGDVAKTAEGDCQKGADPAAQAAACAIVVADMPDKKWAALKLGDAHLALNQPRDAIEAYGLVLLADPKNSRALAQRGRAYLAKGDRGKAKKDFEAALSIDPRQTDAQIGYATALLEGEKQEDLQKVYVELEKIVRAAPESVEALLTRGEVALKLSGLGTDKVEQAKKLDVAAADFDKVIARLDKSNVRGLMGASDVAWARSDVDTSLSLLGKVIDATPSHAKARSNRAERLLAKRDFAGAIADLTILIDSSASAERDVWRRSRAEAYFAAGQYEKAVADADLLIAPYKAKLQDLAKDNPEDALSSLSRTVTNMSLSGLEFLRGRAHFMTGKLDLAAADFRSSMTRETGTKASAQNFLGQVLMAQGDCAGGLKEMNAAAALNPKTGVNMSVAIAELCVADYDAAAKDSLDVSQRRPDYAYPLLFRYIALARKGEAAAGKDLKANAERLKSKEWPYAAIEMMLGNRDPDALLLVAANDDQRCEANYYASAWRVLNGDTTGGEANLQKAVAICPKAFIEYALAINDLKSLKTPNH